VNRAAVHLRLKNYRSCTLDCAGALKLNPRNVKATYRSGKALLALSRLDEAEVVCMRGLALDPENKPLKELSEAIGVQKKLSTAAAEAERARFERIGNENRVLQAALKARGIRTRSTGQPPEMADTKLKLVPDPCDPHSTLSFPTVLLYPIHLKSDFIQAFNSTLAMSFRCRGISTNCIAPPPWSASWRPPTGAWSSLEGNFRC
jgi:hypothetical protein